MINQLPGTRLDCIAPVYAAVWQSAHRHICTPEFIAAHTPVYMEQVLQKKLKEGWQFFALEVQDNPLGMGGFNRSTGEVGLLYVWPAYQGKGYGTQLLRYGVSCLAQHPDLHLWVLNTNQSAIRLYMREGFVFCGEKQIAELKYRFMEERTKLSEKCQDLFN